MTIAQFPVLISKIISSFSRMAKFDSILNLLKMIRVQSLRTGPAPILHVGDHSCMLNMMPLVSSMAIILIIERPTTNMATVLLNRWFTVEENTSGTAPEAKKEAYYTTDYTRPVMTIPYRSAEPPEEIHIAQSRLRGDTCHPDVIPSGSQGVDRQFTVVPVFVPGDNTRTGEWLMGYADPQVVGANDGASPSPSAAPSSPPLPYTQIRPRNGSRRRRELRRHRMYISKRISETKLIISNLLQGK